MADEIDEDAKERLAFEEWKANKTHQEDASGSAGDTGSDPDESEEDRIARAVQAALAKEREQVRAASPQSLVPAHAGGIGVDAFEPTWSQYDQELAASGDHPLQNK